jgi:hypothetical protein
MVLGPGIHGQGKPDHGGFYASHDGLGLRLIDRIGEWVESRFYRWFSCSLVFLLALHAFVK